MFVRSAWLTASFALVLCTSFHAAGFDDKDKDKDKAKLKDQPQAPIEVNEWSIWVGNPAQTSLNAARIYRNAMPNVVGTSRPKFEDKELAAKFAIAPISVVQFFGEPCRDIDVDVRAKKGSLLAHWPASKELAGRLQWFKSDLTASPPAGIPQSYLPGTHWLAKLRDNNAALFLKYESHFERFIAYDAELTLPIPLKLRGGPDEYTLQNLTNRRLLDVAVIAPAESGFRVGWLDELPTAVPEKKDEPAAKKPADPKDKAALKEKAEAIFKDAETKPKEEEIPPLPAEGDATVKARVDQLLNQMVSVAVDQAPRRELINLITRQARLRYEVDDRTLAKEQIDLESAGEPEGPQHRGAGCTCRGSGQYRAQLPRHRRGQALYHHGYPPGRRLRQERRSSRARRSSSICPSRARRPTRRTASSPTTPWPAAWPGKVCAKTSSSSSSPSTVQQLFAPGELIVLAHFSREAIDEAVLLDVFPAPKKIVRTALLVIHGVDPRLQDRARTFVKQLGDPSYKIRETAEGKLQELGPVAVPALEDALTNKDVEIVVRAERLLLKLNRSVP